LVRLRELSQEPSRGGIGRRLLGEAIQRAPQFGLKTLTAGAFAHNVPSLKLFEDFGFERWAHYPKVAELDGVERDLGVLGLRLDDPVAGAYRPSSCGLDLRGST
jgi:L-amino acid N-acyltransferase YncA